MLVKISGGGDQEAGQCAKHKGVWQGQSNFRMIYCTKHQNTYFNGTVCHLRGISTTK